MIENSKKKSVNSKNKLPVKVLISASILLGLAIYAMLTYEPKPIAHNFYENRKKVDTYEVYKNTDSAKKKAERNIFLQD